MINTFVYLNPNSLSREICEKIINLYEEDTEKFDGRTFSGVNKKVKDTMDLMINSDDSKWEKIDKLLKKELQNNVKKYIYEINTTVKKFNIESTTTETEFKLFEKNLTIENNFMVQKYKSGSGKYVFHHDGHIDWEKKKYRVITFLWYLKDVLEGGETDFCGFKIQPKAGQLILFPASWCYPHCGKKPISSDKYIITGWLYYKE
jgi:hypothetical protein